METISDHCREEQEDSVPSIIANYIRWKKDVFVRTLNIPTDCPAQVQFEFYVAQPTMAIVKLSEPDKKSHSQCEV